MMVIVYIALIAVFVLLFSIIAILLIYYKNMREEIHQVESRLFDLKMIIVPFSDLKIEPFIDNEIDPGIYKK